MANHLRQLPKRLSLPLRPCLHFQCSKRILSHSARHLASSAPNGDHNASPPSKTSTKEIAYTSDSYPHLQRDRRFTRLTREHVEHFESIVGTPAGLIDGVTTDATDEATATADLEPFNSDWMRKYRGHARLVLRPTSTAQVSAILRYCNEHMLAVVPQGGNSGLVGGSVPVFDEIVISMARMNEIRAFDEVAGVLVVDAGVILETADAFLRQRGHLFPLDLGAKGSCHVGGNVATNAGGLRLLRYGSLHGTVLGIEAVLPDGTVLDDLSTLRKNNTGYDLKQLFIGGEGTIGIITAVAIACPHKPAAVNVAFFGLESFAKVQQAFSLAKARLGEILSAFELMDANSQNLVHTVTGHTRPLAHQHAFYCLIETSGSNAEHDQAKLESFIEHLLATDIVADGTLAQDETQSRALWAWREGITECLGHWGGTYKYDVSIPLPALYSLVDDTRARLAERGLLGATDEFPVADVVGYGHVGDSNLHLNVAVRRYGRDVEAALEPWVYEWIQRHKGSISAEHGLGLAKKAYVRYSRSEATLGLMRGIKRLYDPNGIMNPYKYI